MEELERIKREIRAIAMRPRAVRFTEIEWVVRKLEQLGYSVSMRRAKEMMLFRVGEYRFGVCDHNPGSKHVKAVYVKEFLKAMIALELLEGD